MKDPRDFFPGDPPLGEWLSLLAGVFGILFALWYATRGRANSPSPRRNIAIAVCLLLPPAKLMLERHSGSWKKLQTRLIAFETEATQVREKCNWNRDCMVGYFDRKYGTTKFQFTPEYAPVHFTFHGTEVSPAVDFGGGATAIFDSTWMLTVYSD